MANTQRDPSDLNSTQDAAILVDEEEHSLPHESSPLLSSDDTRPVKPSPYLNNVSSGRFWFIFLQILFTQFISCFDGTIMSSSHPVITSHFHAANTASWLSTAYLLTSSAFQPLLGRLSDAVGRKPLFVGCIIIFLGATVWCALAQSIESFIAARAVCGIGGGGSMTLGVILVSDLVPIERRGNFQGLINVNVGAGSALGAALGGAMAESLGWRWEFGIQVPVLAVCAGIAMIALPNELGRKQGDQAKTVWKTLKDFDSTGSLTLTVAVTTLILGLNLGGNVLPWSHPFVITSLSLFVLSCISFVFIEGRVKMPVMPLSLLSQSPRANLIFSNFLAALIINGIIFNVPLYFQAVLLTSATSSGLYLVVPTVVSSIAGAATGFTVTATRRMKWPLVSGTILLFVGSVILSFLQRGLPRIVYLLTLIPSSLGSGIQFPGTFIAILACSEQSDQAVITSTLVLWRLMGMVLGVAMSSLVVQNALLYYLAQYVTGEDRLEIIDKVRKSVNAIADLPLGSREEVIHSYEASLRLAFISCAIMAFISMLIILPLRLPRLTPK